MALFSECRLKCAQNMLDIADIVRDEPHQHRSYERARHVFNGRDGLISGIDQIGIQIRHAAVEEASGYTLKPAGTSGNCIATEPEQYGDIQRNDDNQRKTVPDRVSPLAAVMVKVPV